MARTRTLVWVHAAATQTYRALAFVECKMSQNKRAPSLKQYRLPTWPRLAAAMGRVSKRLNSLLMG